MRRPLRHLASSATSTLTLLPAETCPFSRARPVQLTNDYFLFQPYVSKMRLLKINPGVDGFSLVKVIPNKIPRYAILSHTWETDDQEVTFQDITNGVGHNKSGYEKIKFCRNQAQKDGLDYFWIDSCCIDQSSSAELSAAINTMFRWYRNAATCYVYLADVAAADCSWETCFRSSRWFSRGWTLQELLAPASLEFFSQDGTKLGSKKSLEIQIQQVTGVPTKALQGDSLPQISIDERMSWIANRETTVEEDIAYSLFGIFNIHMSLIYGEGAIKALRRLGEEIEKSLAFYQRGKPATLDH
jgi:hypothetical protein